MDDVKRAELHRLGIQETYCTPGASAAAFFDIDESHQSWHGVWEWMVRWRSTDIARTEFTARELEDARYLEILPDWHHGYPQPENDFAFRDVTYAPGSYCETCHIGKRQQAPFRMKKEPKWGRKHILQMHWIPDEFFVLPEVWEQVFKPFGIECQPVMHHKADTELETVVQLSIRDVASSPLVVEGEDDAMISALYDRLPNGSPLAINGKYVFERCAQCGREKYHWVTRGYFPPFATMPSLPMFRTQEWFGSGGAAGKAIIISADVYKAIRENKLRGAIFTPLADAPKVEARRT